MMRALGVILTVVFVAASMAGTAATGWILGEAVHPARAGNIIGPLTLGMLLAGLACIVETLRVAVSACGEHIWRRSRFQGVAFAAPLWLACTGYCTFMPLLALTLVPLLPSGSHMLTVIAPAWAAVQIVTGLLPGIRWSPAAKPAQAASLSEPAEGFAQAVPVQPAHSLQSPAPSLEPDDPRPSPLEVVRPAPVNAGPQLVSELAGSADDLYRFLSRLSELPAGSTLPRRGRIGAGREILISQSGLAALVGRSKPTIRGWLQELERNARIVKRPMGKYTCILLSQYAQSVNGHLNGVAKDAA